MAPAETLMTTPSPRRSSPPSKGALNRRAWPSRLEVHSAVFEYIEAFYNRQRRHSTLDMLAPANYEQLSLPNG
jgi:transposase InsO family protein